MDGKIIIEEYSPMWMEDYKIEEKLIKEVLGSVCLDIQQIGSTSIEDLGSKPIIDIMCGVTKLNEIEKYIQSFNEIGYEFVWHEEFPERRFFRKGKWRAGTHHLHVYQFNSEYWNNNLLFRDYLRKNKIARQEYYDLKVKLAKTFPHDRVAYTNGKNSFINHIIKRAQEKLSFE